MRIAVNTRLLLKGKLEGIGWVAYETLKRIVLSHPEVEFYFIFDRKPDSMFLFADNVKPVVLFPQARHPFLFIWFFELSIPRKLRKIKADLFYSPDGYLSLRSKVPQVVEFHDLNFEHFPGDMPKIHLWHYKKFFPKFARKAKRIVTVSEFSKQDIVDCYQVDPEKIDVAYNGANMIFKPLSDAKKSVVRANYSFGHPYFMFVGSLHPRKNLARLFTAFDRFKQHNRNDVKLVIVGEKRWWTEPIQKAYDAMSCKDDVIFVIASAMESSLKGSTNKAASCATSGIEVTLEVITGVSQRKASKIGIPKPSKYDTYTDANAAAVTRCKSSALKRPTKMTSSLQLIAS